MKKIYFKISLFSVAFFFFDSLINAKVITCSNNVLTAGQYTSVQAAHDAASAGDTIYVTPSTSSYGDITINKRLTLIGGGYFVTGTQFNNISLLGNIYLNNAYPNTITSGLRIQGLKFGSLSRTSSANNVDGVTVERCNSTSTFYIFGNNWILKNCSTADINIGDYYYSAYLSQNVIISNNFIGGQITYNSNYNSANPSVLILNNIFYYYGRIGSVSYATIANNIFYFSNTSYSDPNGGCTNCTFNYNITYSTLTPYATLPNASNSGGNNLNNTNPNFIGTQYGASNYSNSTATSFYTNNWHLTSPILGSDGREIGIYGGFYPPANTGGVPAIPQMQLLNINNSVVPQGGIINVNFKARKQN